MADPQPETTATKTFTQGALLIVATSVGVSLSSFLGSTNAMLLCLVVAPLWGATVLGWEIAHGR